jgi:hypothetical protein
MRSCEARLLLDEDGNAIPDASSEEVILAIVEASTASINEALVDVRKQSPDMDWPDVPSVVDSIDAPPCGKPAVEFVDRRGIRVWLCADHFDVYDKAPLPENIQTDDLEEDEPESTGEASN